MSLQSLVLSSDDDTMRVLRRVLADQEISVEHCTDADSAVIKLSRQRFEAVIVDGDDENMATRVLTTLRSAPRNRHAIAIAVLKGQGAAQKALEIGAHFVLIKPLSFERARNSFQTARALMKCERRRHARVPVQIPVTVLSAEGKGQEKAVTSDISEGGMALQLSRQARKSGSIRLRFGLPATNHVVECAAEVAWENAGSQTGIRFVDLSPESRDQLRSWLARHSREIVQDDPPVPCKLTDLSPAACYLQMVAPLPAGTRLKLLMKLPYGSIMVDGAVQITHPEAGMGVEFTQRTGPQREQVEKFIQALISVKGELPQLEVQPDSLQDAAPASPEVTPQPGAVDPLLDLFRRSSGFSGQEFQAELQKQRGGRAKAARPAASS
jgi:CheY-like chemotaxis protein